MTRRRPPAPSGPCSAWRSTSTATGLEHGLLHLVKLRASQLNGSADWIDMHSKEARAAGETEQWLDLLDAWREAPSTPTASVRRSPGPRR
nr:carboxymuconolactone decarboxylase family protein [Singulisphaera sp. GP187]